MDLYSSTTRHGRPRSAADDFGTGHSALDDAARRVEQAYEYAAQSKRAGDDRHRVRLAEDGLRAAIHAATDAGVRWGTIGDILGVARSCAYQRYRRKHQVP